MKITGDALPARRRPEACVVPDQVTGKEAHYPGNSAEIETSVARPVAESLRRSAAAKERRDPA